MELIIQAIQALVINEYPAQVTYRPTSFDGYELFPILILNKITTSWNFLSQRHRDVITLPITANTDID